jgi:hypothetical protein
MLDRLISGCSARCACRIRNSPYAKVTLGARRFGEFAGIDCGSQSPWPRRILLIILKNRILLSGI